MKPFRIKGAITIALATSMVGCMSATDAVDPETPAPVSRNATCAKVEELASYPHGNFLENLIVEKTGRVLYTSYFAKEIDSFTTSAGSAAFAALNVHPVSVTALENGYLVAVHGKPFTSGPGFVRTNGFLVLDRRGNVRKRFAAKDALFLNGQVKLPTGKLLVADSILGRIWAVDPKRGRLALWLDAPEFKPDPTGKDQRPGVNGLKVFRDALYASNSFTGRIYRIGLKADGAPAAGAVSIVADIGHVDDFVVKDDGTIFAATHANTVLSITPEGKVATVLPEGGDGSTAVAFSDASMSALYVLTTGNFVEGGKKPARLLRVGLPGGEVVCPRDN